MLSIDLGELKNKSILVIGDVMLDRYVWGDVTRISPEAPVPIVRIQEKSEVLGGAGNVAANLSALGCRVTLMGVCGTDQEGKRLSDLSGQKGIETCFMKDGGRSTITKTRIMAHHQQLMRLDEEQTCPMPSDFQNRMLEKIREQIESLQAVILSDYGKGIFHAPGFCQQVIETCMNNHVPVMVDPKGTDWNRYQGATCITPNTAEFQLVAGDLSTNTEKTLSKAAEAIRRRYGLEWLLVTRGAKGMLLCGPKAKPAYIPAKSREVYDVSGAGDTVIASLAAGLAIGLDFPDAAAFANTAAGIAVGKLGTQPVQAAELETALKWENSQGRQTGIMKVLTAENAVMQLHSWRSTGDRIVFTNGCFDLLHPGHINLLHQARSFGDRLVVGLNTDASIRRLKGEKRPILHERDRAAILSALGSVDLVVLFAEDTPLELIKKLKPDILVKGADYRMDQVVGGDIVHAYGGDVRLVKLLKGYSTTDITQKVMMADKRDSD